jgi:hypothetical protein
MFYEIVPDDESDRPGFPVVINSLKEESKFQRLWQWRPHPIWVKRWLSMIGFVLFFRTIFFVLDSYAQPKGVAVAKAPRELMFNWLVVCIVFAVPSTFLLEFMLKTLNTVKSTLTDRQLGIIVCLLALVVGSQMFIQLGLSQALLIAFASLIVLCLVLKSFGRRG